HRAPARVDVAQAQLPGNDPRGAVDAGAAGRPPAEVADDGHARRVDVETECVGAGHGPVDAAAPSLPDPAEAIEEEAVADVAPAVRVHVVRLDRPQDAGHIAGRVR